MKVGIHGQAGRDYNEYIQRYETILRHNNIPSIRLDISDLDFWEKLKGCTHFIFRWGQVHDADRQIAHNILPVIEKELNIKTFPNQKTCWHFDNKIAEYYLSKAHNFPFEKCWVFWDKPSALKWVGIADYPVVAKLSGGAGSRNVKLIHSKKDAKKLINRMFHAGVQHGSFDLQDKVTSRGYIKTAMSFIKAKLCGAIRVGPIPTHWNTHQHYVLFQKYLPGNLFDVRIVTIGKRAFGYRRFQRPADFRASGSGLKDLNHKNIDLNCVEMALKHSKKLGFQSMAYDFFYDSNKKPRILEISYTYPELAVVNLPGYWDNDLKWHSGNYWPQYWHLVDLLNEEDLKQPKMSFEQKWDFLPDGEALHPTLINHNKF